ncbi:MAG: exodeoxyribonuclease VII large subunit [Deltaproteobacteria bacterium]|nr:MAG: exodeoxyribonuclease VII large subunit [Deltaproteobacteria bacterium]
MREMSERKIYSVSELTQEIRGLLEENFDYIWVKGEISNFRVPPSGHFYFTLKDPDAQIRVVMFKSQNVLLKFLPEDGLQVICSGRVSVYEPRGEYQIVVDLLEPKGIGALQLAFEQLKERLEKEGLFEPAHKKPLPFLPQRIGIVTSPTGAAIRDILKVIERRFANVHLLINPVRVQGEGAGKEIARAIRQFNQLKDIDLLIVGRGGGSLEDLWVFNEEVVARAIFNSRIPVISAVGHEIDFTIADFVADLRAPTPSVAAELAVRNKEELQAAIETLGERLGRTIKTGLEDLRSRVEISLRVLGDPRRRLRDYHQRVDELWGHLSYTVSQLLLRKKQIVAKLEKEVQLLSPLSQIGSWRNSLSQSHQALGSAVIYYLKLNRQRLSSRVEKLDSLSPLAILRRGYGIIRKELSGEIVKDTKQVDIRERLRVKLYKGELTCSVEEK